MSLKGPESTGSGTARAVEKKAVEAGADPNRCLISKARGGRQTPTHILLTGSPLSYKAQMYHANQECISYLPWSFFNTRNLPGCDSRLEHLVWRSYRRGVVWCAASRFLRNWTLYAVFFCQSYNRRYFLFSSSTSIADAAYSSGTSLCSSCGLVALTPICSQPARWIGFFFFRLHLFFFFLVALCHVALCKEGPVRKQAQVIWNCVFCHDELSLCWRIRKCWEEGGVYILG